MEPVRESFALLSAIDVCYQAVLEPSAWWIAMRETAAMLEATACAIGAHAIAGRSGRLLWHAGFLEGFPARYGRDFAALDPWVQALGRRHTPGGVLEGTGLVPEPDLAAGAFYSEWLGPQDLHHWCGAILARNGEEMVCLHAMRPRTHGPFGPRALRQATLLLPHLRRAQLLTGLLQTRSCADDRHDSRPLELDRAPSLPAPPMVAAPAAPASPVDPPALQARFELTSAEARVAALLAAGHSVADIADRLGIGVNTVRTHLQRAFAKTGTRRQSELVALMLRPEHAGAF